MVSRRTARCLATLIANTFSKTYYPVGTGSNYSVPETDKLYDFLYEAGYEAWFCNASKSTYEPRTTRKLQEFIMKLHTGETAVSVTSEWTWQQREKLGQQYLENLAADILKYYSNQDSHSTFVDSLVKNLALDGYQYTNGQLLPSEEDILDVQEESGVLRSLYASLGLANPDTAFHHLQLSEQHYLENRWDDSISNSRKFLESVLQEIAAAYSLHCQSTPLDENIYKRPVKVRDYLEKEGLLEKKEKEALASVYGLLSETGGHPYMAENDQARLLRHLALTFAQFVMLRLKGRLGV